LFALFEPVGNTGNQSLVVGPARLILTAATVAVSGWHLRSVICEQCVITYFGGPVILERVYFERCSFQVVQNESGFQFAKAILLQLIGPINYVAK
jgi:hypothetical protein